MADERLEYYARQPIDNAARANKVWLPEGRLPPKRADDAELLNRRANSSARRVRENHEAGEKLNALLDYYATTTVPFDRIATHIGKSVEFVSGEMKQRGRSA